MNILIYKQCCRVYLTPTCEFRKIKIHIKIFYDKVKIGKSQGPEKLILYLNNICCIY